MGVKRTLSALLSCLLLLSFSCIPVSAETALPDSAVKGLPEKLTAMDSDGQSISSDTGEYCFCVENMAYGELYTKDIQLINLRDDQAYHIYLRTEPIAKSGDIDLEKACHCTFYLDGTEVYSGNVNGVGNIDLTSDALDLGEYQPGEQHTLRCNVIWDEVDVFSKQSGYRIVDQNGTKVLQGDGEYGSFKGEMTFKWIFYAAVDESYAPPHTGLLAVNGTFWLISIAAAAAMTAVMLAMFLSQKLKRKRPA